MTRVAWAACALSFLIAGSAFADAKSEATAISQAFARAINAGDVAGILALYADDASVVWPIQGDEAKGEAAIQRLVRATLGRKVHTQAKLERIDAIPLGDKYIAVVGHWTYSVTTPEGKPKTLPVRSSQVLVKGGDGKWRYLIDHASLGLEPPVAAVRPPTATPQPAATPPAAAPAGTQPPAGAPPPAPTQKPTAAAQ